MQASSPFLISYIVFLTLIPSLRPFKMFPDWQCLCSDARQTISGFLFLLSFPSPPPHLTKTKDLKEMGGGKAKTRKRNIYTDSQEELSCHHSKFGEKNPLYIWCNWYFYFPCIKVNKTCYHCCLFVCSVSCKQMIIKGMYDLHLNFILPLYIWEFKPTAHLWLWVSS